MRTRKAWIAAIKDGEIKERIKLNTNGKAWDNEFKKYKTLDEAHHSMFNWQESPEGLDYWSDINEEMRNNPEDFIWLVQYAEKTFDDHCEEFTFENIVKVAQPTTLDKINTSQVSLNLLEKYTTSDLYPEDFRKDIEDVIKDFTILVAQKIDIINSHANHPKEKDALKYRRKCRSIAKSQKLELIELILKF